MNVEDDDEVIVLNEDIDIEDDDWAVEENQRRVVARSFDTPYDSPADGFNPYGIDDDVFDFGEFDKE